MLGLFAVLKNVPTLEAQMSKIEISTKKFGIRVLAEGVVAIIIALTLAISIFWLLYLKA